MDDRTVRAALERHWAASDASDFNVEHEIYREDAVLDYPQSGERIRGRHNMRQSRWVQPNSKRFTVRRITGSGELWVTEFVLSYDGVPKPAYFDLYTSTAQPMNVYSKFFTNRLSYKDEAAARASVELIDQFYRQFELAGDRSGQHHALLPAGHDLQQWPLPVQRLHGQRRLPAELFLQSRTVRAGRGLRHRGQPSLPDGLSLQRPDLRSRRLPDHRLPSGAVRRLSLERRG